MHVHALHLFLWVADVWRFVRVVDAYIVYAYGIVLFCTFCYF